MILTLPVSQSQLSAAIAKPIGAELRGRQTTMVSMPQLVNYQLAHEIGGLGLLGSLP